MFLVPSLCSLGIDILLVWGYVNVLKVDTDVTDFFVVCVAMARIVMLVPLGWHYLKNRTFKYAKTVRRCELIFGWLMGFRVLYLLFRDGAQVNEFITPLAVAAGSLASTALHHLAVGHMTSSVQEYELAVAPRSVFLGGRGKGAFGGSGELGPADLAALEEGFDAAVLRVGTWPQASKGELRSKWDQLLQGVSGMLGTAGGGGGGPGGAQAPAAFLLFCRLFAYHDVMDDIDRGFDRDPEGYEFYLTQLVLFLLHGSFRDAQRLEALLLGRCRQSLHFGHQMFWVLRAFGAEGARLTDEAQAAIAALLNEVCLEAESKGLHLSQGQGPGEGLEGVRFPLEHFVCHSAAGPMPPPPALRPARSATAAARAAGAGAGAGAAEAVPAGARLYVGGGGGGGGWRGSVDSFGEGAGRRHRRRDTLESASSFGAELLAGGGGGGGGGARLWERHGGGEEEGEGEGGAAAAGADADAWSLNDGGESLRSDGTLQLEVAPHSDAEGEEEELGGAASSGGEEDADDATEATPKSFGNGNSHDGARVSPTGGGGDGGGTPAKPPSESGSHGALSVVGNVVKALRKAERGPLKDALGRPLSPRPYSLLDAGAQYLYSYPGNSIFFTAQLKFIDELCATAARLKAVKRRHRDRILRKALNRLNRERLPSRLLYLPVGNRRHRIYRIHTSESFSFSTKERVPILVCVEVLDYSRLAEGAASAAAAAALSPSGSVGGGLGDRAALWSRANGPLVGGGAAGAGGGGGGGGGLHSAPTPQKLGLIQAYYGGHGAGTPGAARGGAGAGAGPPGLAGATPGRWWTRQRSTDSAGGGGGGGGSGGGGGGRSLGLAVPGGGPAEASPKATVRNKHKPTFSRAEREKLLGAEREELQWSPAVRRGELGGAARGAGEAYGAVANPRLEGGATAEEMLRALPRPDFRPSSKQRSSLPSPRRDSQISREGRRAAEKRKKNTLQELMGQWYTSKKGGKGVGDKKPSMHAKIMEVFTGKTPDPLPSEAAWSERFSDTASELGPASELGHSGHGAAGASGGGAGGGPAGRRTAPPRASSPLVPLAESLDVGGGGRAAAAAAAAGRSLSAPRPGPREEEEEGAHRRYLQQQPLKPKTSPGPGPPRPEDRGMVKTFSSESLQGKVKVAFVKGGEAGAGAGAARGDEDEDPDAPGENHPAVIFKESWADKEERVRRRSPIGHLPGWRLVPVIVKADDDLRQEMLASQLVKQVAQILRDAALPVYVRPYDILATGGGCGVIEAVPDTVSIDALKRNDSQFTTLLDFFERRFGYEGSPGFIEARNCFVESLSAYSILCYLLNLKDRHNGNILLDSEGHAIHIDFGFMLARTPGNANFERAPFKLTEEWVELLGGKGSACFRRFRGLCVDVFMALRRRYQEIIYLVEMTANGNEHLPCFGGQPEEVITALAARFRPDLHDRAAAAYVHHLVEDATHNWRTTFYDKYQQCFVGIKG